jgi:hypothetical protein
MTIDGITRLKTGGGKWSDPPRPLMREMPPADPFPIDALVDVLGAACHS